MIADPTGKNLKYPVAIFDNDIYVRRGLSSLIDWPSYGFTFLDGGPDLHSIDDLRNGLLLCEYSILKQNSELYNKIMDRSEGPRLIILFESKEFAVARDAMELKADALVFKPVDICLLMENVRKIAAQLKGRKNPAININRIEEIEKIRRECLLKELCACSDSKGVEISRRLTQLGIDFDSFFLLRLDLDGLERSQAVDSRFRNGLYRLAKEFFASEFSVHLFEDINNQLLLLLIPHLKRQTGIRERIFSYLEELMESVKSNLGASLTIAVSSPGGGFDDFFNRYAETNAMMERKFFDGSGIIIKSACAIDEIRSSDLFGPDLLDTIFEHIKSGREEELKTLAYSLIPKNRDGLSKTIVRERLWDICLRVHSLEFSASDRPDSTAARSAEIISELARRDTADELIDYILQCVSIASGRIFRLQNENNSKLVTKVKKYMRENYKEPISLESAAAFVYVSPAYLSRIFKRVSGENFNEYLTEIRLEFAKRLLIETKYKTYEVADMVGIFDSNYFSRLFKKKAHMTPTEFRETNSSY